MKEISYIIDKELSLKNSCLAIKTGATVKNIPSKEWIQELKAMAMKGKIYFNEKLLAVDFFGKADFKILVDVNPNGKIKLTGKLKWSQHEIDLQDCDFIAQGPPHFFIKGIHLKIIGSAISWKELNRLIKNEPEFKPADIQEMQEAHAEDSNEPEIILAPSAKFALQQMQEPQPFLILKDRTGAFADLWMDYGHEKKAYHDAISKRTATEKAFEQDLFETDFTSKQMANSHYYCPLDKVSKSLTFLLEIGWKIFDFQGRQILRQSDFELNLTNFNDKVEAKGILKYNEHTVNLANIVGAFNRRERFVQLSDNCIGLIPDRFEDKALNSLMEISEVVADKVLIKRHSIGSLEDLFENRNIQTDADLSAIREKLTNFQGISETIIPEQFKGILRPYQKQGVNFLKFLYDYHFHGILADDMGLGKTVQVLAFLTLLKPVNPILIVLPASLVFNWQLEIKRFTPHFNVSVFKESVDTQADIILTTYSMLRIHLPKFEQIDFECLILDEAQTIKNAHTQIAKALFSLKSRFRLSITGTPIENHLSELWSHFRFLMPELLGPENQFLADVQASNSDLRYLQKIKKKIRPFVLRRKKEEVAKDLPEKIEQTVFVELEEHQRKVYEDYLAGVKHSLILKIGTDGFSKHRMEVLEAILRLRQICCHPLLVSQDVESVNTSAKMELLLEDIVETVSEGRKILVYSQFTSMLKLIAKSLNEKNLNFVYLDGSTKDRETVVSKFQNDPEIPLFLISLKAGGIGLNLTAADDVLLFDPWWNEAVENQAINRAHRIGRKGSVFAKRYICRDTIEEKMMTLKTHKGKMADGLLDEDLGAAGLTEDDFRFLIDL